MLRFSKINKPKEFDFIYLLSQKNSNEIYKKGKYTSINPVNFSF